MRQTILFTLAAMGLAAAAITWARPAGLDAQGPRLEPLAVYGARYIVPVPNLKGDHDSIDMATLRVSNIGWESADVGILAISRPAAFLECPEALAPSQLIGSWCVNVGAAALANVPLVVEGASHLVVYSLAAGGQCTALQAVASGVTPLGEWERNTWQPGPDIAVVLDTNGPTTTGQLAHIDLLGPQTDRALPAGWGMPLRPHEGKVRAVIINGTPQCVNATLAAGDCGAVESAAAVLPPYGAADVDAGRDFESGLTIAGPRLLYGLVEQRTDDSWIAYTPQGVSRELGREMFVPWAGGLVDQAASELWVTNHHMTATTQIDIIMMDGNAAVVKLHRDPDQLCPGATRAYDIAGLAGPLPPTGRGGGPILSLSVTSTNLEMERPPSISGAIVLRTPLGDLAYAAQSADNPLLPLLGRDTSPGGLPVFVVPGVMNAFGTPAKTTTLILQSMRQGNVARFTADFYDDAGRPVLTGAVVQARGNAGGFVHLSQPMGPLGGDQMRLPQGYRGTVILRPENARGAFAVLALDRPAEADRPGPTSGKLRLAEGRLLLRGADPNAPTATATSTLRPPMPTVTPGPESWRVFLPWSHTARMP